MTLHTQKPLDSKPPRYNLNLSIKHMSTYTRTAYLVFICVISELNSKSGTKYARNIVEKPIDLLPLCSTKRISVLFAILFHFFFF